MRDQENEIYNLIRNAFDSKSGFFLNKSESHEVMLKIKELFEAKAPGRFLGSLFDSRFLST